MAPPPDEMSPAGPPAEDGAEASQSPHQFLTAPVPSSRMPSGIPFIVGNEAAERFSFYGMKSILFVFMTGHLFSSTGADDFLTKTEATEWQAWFVASAYFFPVFGALASDIFLGKYRTILMLSMVYCVGHLSLAMMDLPGTRNARINRRTANIPDHWAVSDRRRQRWNQTMCVSARRRSIWPVQPTHALESVWLVLRVDQCRGCGVALRHSVATQTRRPRLGFRCAWHPDGPGHAGVLDGPASICSHPRRWARFPPGSF